VATAREVYSLTTCAEDVEALAASGHWGRDRPAQER
jgi:hypothetical protein